MINRVFPLVKVYNMYDILNKEIVMQVHGKDSRGKHLKKNQLKDAKRRGLTVAKNKIVKQKKA